MAAVANLAMALVDLELELLSLAADVPADEVDEAAFGIFSELVVVIGFLADDEPSAAVAGVKPFRGGRGDAAATVEAHAGPHFDKRSTLRQLRRLFVLDLDQGEPLVVPEDADRTDRNFIAGRGLADGVPVSGGQGHQAHHDHWREHDGGENKEEFFHCWDFGFPGDFLPVQKCDDTLSSKNPILSTPAQ